MKSLIKNYNDVIIRFSMLFKDSKIIAPFIDTFLQLILLVHCLRFKSNRIRTVLDIPKTTELETNNIPTIVY